MYRRFLFTAIFLISGVLSLCAQTEKKKILARDSSVIAPREPSKSVTDNYFDDDTWRYERDKTDTKTEPSVFDRMWNGFWEKVLNSLQGDRSDKKFNPWTILWILILVTIVVLVILKVTDTGVSTLFSGKTRKTEKIDATLEDVDIHAIDYEKQIREAIANKDFRLGVRLWFLRTLKSFSDKELLRWQIDKTNSDYYYELSGSTYQKEFGEVSNVYDYIWYGEFPVDESSYSKAEEQFSVLSKKVGNG